MGDIFLLFLDFLRFSNKEQCVQNPATRRMPSYECVARVGDKIFVPKKYSFEDVSHLQFDAYYELLSIEQKEMCVCYNVLLLAGGNQGTREPIKKEVMCEHEFLVYREYYEKKHFENGREE